MKKFRSFFRSFSIHSNCESASSARLPQGLMIGLNTLLAGAALVSVAIAIKAQLADSIVAAPDSEDVSAEPHPPIHWDPMLNPVEYTQAEAPFKTEEESRTDKFGAFTISDPKDFSEQMLRYKTKEDVDKEESAMFAVKNPEAHRKQVDSKKNEEQRQADEASALAIEQPDTYNKQRAREKDSEEKRLEALAIKDILNPDQSRSSDGAPEPKPKPGKN